MTEIRRVSKPIPEPVYPTYVVEQPDYESEPVCMVSVNKQNSQVDQTDELLRKLLEALTPVTPPPIRVPKATPLDKLTELLMSQLVVTGLGHSTRPCIFSVFRGHIHNCVKRV